MPQFHEKPESHMLQRALAPEDLTPAERKALGHAATLILGGLPIEQVPVSVDSPIQSTNVPTSGELRPIVLRSRGPKMSLEDFLKSRQEDQSQPEL